MLIAAGWHTPFGRVLYVLPVIGKLRAVERALVLAAFALAALAGFGLQRIVEASGNRAWSAGGRRLIVAVPGLFVTRVYLRPTEPLFGVPAQDVARLSLALPHTWLPLLLAAASALLIAWWSRAPARPLTLADRRRARPPGSRRVCDHVHAHGPTSHVPLAAAGD